MPVLHKNVDEPRRPSWKSGSTVLRAPAFPVLFRYNHSLLIVEATTAGLTNSTSSDCALSLQGHS